MALVKPTIIDPVSGRQNGTRFYRAGGRLFARQIVHQVNPATVLQQQRRSGIAGGTKNWAYVLTPAEQAAWTANSQFGGRGELEISAAAVAAQVAGEPIPTARGIGANAPFSRPVAFIFNSAIPRLTTNIGVPSPAANFIQTIRITPPNPITRFATRRELLVLLSQPATATTIQLALPYVTKFGRVFPNRPTIMMENYNFDRTIGVKGVAVQTVLTDQAATNAARVQIITVPQKVNSSADVLVRPSFNVVPPGFAVPMTIDAPGFTDNSTGVAFNKQNTRFQLTDTLGSARTTQIRLTFATSTTDIIVVEASPAVTL